MVRQIPNPYKIKHTWMNQHADEVEIIFLGSSHTYYGIRPEYIPNSFNLANGSQNLKYDYFMLEQYGGQCKKLKKVVLPISYFTLFSKGFEGTDDWWYAINYKIYMDCDYHSDFSIYNWELAHTSVFRGKLKSSLREKKVGCDSLGWGLDYALSAKQPTWDNTASDAAVERHTAKDFSYLDMNLEYIDKIASFCRENSISLLLITTPTWHTYYEHLDKKQLDKMYSVIRELQHTYSLSYYDYLKDSRFVADDFYDADHLSDVGAKKFSQILWEEHLKR